MPMKQSSGVSKKVEWRNCILRWEPITVKHCQDFRKIRERGKIDLSRSFFEIWRSYNFFPVNGRLTLFVLVAMVMFLYHAYSYCKTSTLKTIFRKKNLFLSKTLWLVSVSCNCCRTDIPCFALTQQKSHVTGVTWPNTEIHTPTQPTPPVAQLRNTPTHPTYSCHPTQKYTHTPNLFLLSSNSEIQTHTQFTPPVAQLRNMPTCQAYLSWIAQLRNTPNLLLL